jgi:Thioesterase-like superfamily
VGGPHGDRELSPGAYFVPEARGLQPVPQARSPWADDMLHGRLLAGLAARAVERDAHDGSLRLARLTLDMFRSPPMKPFTDRTTVVRDGRRVRVLEVSIECEGIEVARASALLLRATETPSSGDVWRAPVWEVPPPESLPPASEDTAALGGWDIRLLSEGGFWSADRKRLWTRDGWQLVDGEPLAPAVRAALAADLPNPLANSGSTGLQYINPDLTLFLSRPPASEWIGLEVTNHIAADGIAVGSCTMYDTSGPIGSSTVTAITNTATLNG